MTNKYLYITLLTMLGLAPDASAQKSAAGQPPRLVVSIAI